MAHLNPALQEPVQEDPVSVFIRSYGYKEISDENIEKISRSHCRSWKRLIPHLEMDKIIRYDICQASINEDEKRHAFFLKWKEIKGSGATYRKLLNALCVIGCKEDAEAVCKIFRNSQSPQQIRGDSEKVTSELESEKLKEQFDEVTGEKLDLKEQLESTLELYHTTKEQLESTQIERDHIMEAFKERCQRDKKMDKEHWIELNKKEEKMKYLLNKQEEKIKNLNIQLNKKEEKIKNLNIKLLPANSCLSALQKRLEEVLLQPHHSPAHSPAASSHADTKQDLPLLESVQLPSTQRQEKDTTDYTKLGTREEVRGKEVKDQATCTVTTTRGVGREESDWFKSVLQAANEAEGRSRKARAKIKAEGRATREAQTAKFEAAREAEAAKIEAEDRAREAEAAKVEAEDRAREAEAAKIEAEDRASKGDQRLAESELGLQRLETQWVVERREIQLTAQELGRGGWGIVSVATFRGARVAAKCIHNNIISRYNIQLFKREINMAARIRHPNLLQFIGATLQGELVILTELMPTSLRRELQTQAMSPLQATGISLDVSRALNYLHLMRPHPLVHRDIGSANVLLEPLSQDRWRAKVSDYGTVNLLQCLDTVCPGNPSYAAPEANDPTQQSPKMDIFSFGVLLLEMLTGQFPQTDERARQLHSIGHQPLLALIQWCLEVSRNDRPNASDIISELDLVLL